MQEQILDKLAKLYAKAKSTDSEQEAQALMAKVQQLLLEHNLAMSTLDNHEAKGKNSVNQKIFEVHRFTTKVEGDWVSKLVNGICNTNLCRAIRERIGTHLTDSIMHIVGREETIPIVIGMIEYLIPTIKRVESQSWSQYRGIQKRGAYRRDFLMACTLRVIERLKENQQKIAQENNNITALVLRNDQSVQVYIKQAFPHLKSSKPTVLKQRDGHFAGKSAANNISLNSQIGTASSRNRLN